MTVQWATTLRNALLDQWEASIGTSAVVKIRDGAPPANCAAADSGTVLVEFDLASDWASAASGGSKSLSSLPVSAAAVASGTAAHYRIYESTETTCFEQGTVTAGGGGGDMIIDNTTIVSGQTVQITAFTKTAPGA